MYRLLHIQATWFQPEASSGTVPSTGVSRGPASGQGPDGLPTIGLMALMMVVIYLMMIRPQQKRQKELDRVLKALKKGQKVRTTGGVRGEIVDFKSETGDEVVLMIADKVKVNILRSHIAGVIDAAGEAEKKS